MGQCCSTQDKEQEVIKTLTATGFTITGGLGGQREGLDDLQLSELDNSEDEHTHGPLNDTAVKVTKIPQRLESKLEYIQRTYPKFEYTYESAMDDKAIFLGPRQFDNQSIYIGHWYNHKRNGKGQQLYPDGSLYEGNWQDDKRQGLGRFIDSAGDVYEGDWLDDIACGRGKYSQRGGASHVGEWRDNKQHGVGREKWPTGETYEGDYELGQKHGKGIFRQTDGSYYKGDFINDKIEGEGRGILTEVSITGKMAEPIQANG